MAEPVYLEILDQGIDIWNEWREENPNALINLREADLSGRDFSFANFVDIDFTGADFGGSNLRQANLSTANLSNANLNGCFLGEVDMSGANLFEALVHGSYLQGAYLFGADFSNADLSESDLSDAHLRNAHLTKTNLVSAILFNTNLYCADLGGANLSKCEMSGCNLTRANLYGADLNEAFLRGADLTKANLIRANLFKTNLCSAVLTRTQMSRAYLGSVDFSHAILRHADLSYTDLTGANLLEADLSYADLSYADLSKTYIAGTQGIGTNFRAVQLTGACLEGWDIDGDTQLHEVDCQYIYLKSKIDRSQGILTRSFEERYPPDSKFKPGEFVQLFQKTMGMVSMVFAEGIDWEAFAETLRNMELEYPQAKLAISSIKNKGTGTIVVKAAVSSEVDRSQFHDEFILSYELLRKALEEQYQAQPEENLVAIIGFSREQVPRREYINSLFRALNSLSSLHRGFTQSPDFEKQRRTLMDFVEPSKPRTGDATILQDPGTGIMYASASTAEVRKILDDLLANYTSQTEGERMSLVSSAADLIRSNRELRTAFVAALQDGGSDTMEDLLDHPLIHLLIDVLEN